MHALVSASKKAVRIMEDDKGLRGPVSVSLNELQSPNGSGVMEVATVLSLSRFGGWVIKIMWCRREGEERHHPVRHVPQIPENRGDFSFSLLHAPMLD
ncbi:hypothetical protein MRB53_020507 [Persea americana]|uniref:Uncharacterized protein n=1 Tax=Persea americana TaxID=3435 RepID=A0ACC2L1R5_PERAE|nr:hypothetical protein MRB53_020507 [Persea americana]